MKRDNDILDGFAGQVLAAMYASGLIKTAIDECPDLTLNQHMQAAAEWAYAQDVEMMKVREQVLK